MPASAQPARTGATCLQPVLTGLIREGNAVMRNNRSGEITVAIDGASDEALLALRELVNPGILPSRHSRQFDEVDSVTFRGLVKTGGRSVSTRIVVVGTETYVDADYLITSGLLRHGRSFTTNRSLIDPHGPVRASTNANCLVIDKRHNTPAVARNVANHLAHLILRDQDTSPANMAWHLD